jgi:Na+/H+ antiporter NhaD/arsenite permease-like protein
MPDPESREEWEKEIIDVQYSVTFPEELRSAQIIAKKLSASPAPISDFAHLVRLLLCGILLVIGFVAFSTDVPHNRALGIAALAAACCLGATAFRWTSKHQ